jgi:HAE1 family hydrophobic/amphiphilic exporter-1
MSLSNNFIVRPVLTTVCSLLIVIEGLIAIPILPIENLPDIAPPHRAGHLALRGGRCGER